MNIGFVILALAGFIIAASYYLKRLMGDEGAGGQRSFWTWVCRGLAAPVLFWTLWNLGILPGLPPVIRQVAQAAGRSQVEAFIVTTAWALFVIGSCWAAVSLAWCLAILGGREEIRGDLLGSAL